MIWEDFSAICYLQRKHVLIKKYRLIKNSIIN